jgi:arginine-tRNA-protein transferase
LCQSNVESVLVEFRDQDELKMVSVIDIVRDGISAVYTFYDTSDIGTSYGTYNVMWQADWTKTLGLAYLYLGYWIKDSQKMAYKQNYKPLQKLINGEWD